MINYVLEFFLFIVVFKMAQIEDRSFNGGKWVKKIEAALLINVQIFIDLASLF